MKIFDEVEGTGEDENGFRQFHATMTVNEFAIAYTGIIILEQEIMNREGDFETKEIVFFPLFLHN